MVVKLPTPSVVVLIGASSSGKSTWAAENFRPGEIVSSDSLRGVVGVDEDDQQASAAAFTILESIVDERLRRKLTTVIDTTGLDADNRSRWMEKSHSAGIPIFAALIDTPNEERERRNAGRSRPLPKSVLTKQASRFREVVRNISNEGFDGILEESSVATAAPQMIIADETKPAAKSDSPHTFGLGISRFDWDVEPERFAETIGSIARRAESVGFRDIWLMDHFRQIPQVGRKWEDLPEPYTILAYLAGVTERIRLGVQVSAVTHRHPAIVGNMVATLDVVSGGRANCGLGIGWDAAEHAAYGIEFPDPAHRYELLVETVEYLRLMWGKGTPAFQGNLIQAEELAGYPRPIQRSIPIMIGGSGERKTLRLVAEVADACGLSGDPRNIEQKVSILRKHCEAVDRDPDEIEVTHRLDTLTAEGKKDLDRRIDFLRGRDQSIDDYSKQHNAGTTDDVVGLFHAYHAAGAQHSIVTIPDAHREGAIESFAPVIEALADS